MNKAILNDILINFNIKEHIVAIEYYRNIVDGDEIKIIAKIDLENKSSVVLRALSERGLKKEHVVSRCGYQAFLGSNKFTVPYQYSCREGYCLIYKIQNVDTMVTLEQYVEPLSNGVISFYRYGQLCAKLHNIAGELKYNNIDAPNGVLAKIINLSSFIPYDKFKSSELNLKYNLIISTITKMETMIKNKISVTPKGFVHGDLSSDNLLITPESEICIIDYNVSGNDILIGSMILNGCGLIYKSCINENSFDKELIAKCWCEYTDGYEKIRKISMDEKEIFNAIMSLVIFTIYVNNHSLNTTLQESNIEIHFDTIINLLNYDYENITFGGRVK